MGSGSRFEYGWSGAVGLGVHIGKFPFKVTVSISVLFWYVQIGFGKGYDK
jgi:hypothetical protein